VVGATVDDRHNAFAAGLSREDRLLMVLRDEIYGGSWDGLRQDLNARLELKPYVIKLATRIEDDLARIERLAGYEQEHSIDLKDYVPGLE